MRKKTPPHVIILQSHEENHNVYASNVDEGEKLSAISTLYDDTNKIKINSAPEKFLRLKRKKLSRKRTSAVHFMER